MGRFNALPVIRQETAAPPGAGMRLWEGLEEGDEIASIGCWQIESVAVASGLALRIHHLVDAGYLPGGEQRRAITDAAERWDPIGPCGSVGHTSHGVVRPDRDQRHAVA